MLNYLEYSFPTKAVVILKGNPIYWFYFVYIWVSILSRYIHWSSYSFQNWIEKRWLLKEAKLNRTTDWWDVLSTLYFIYIYLHFCTLYTFCWTYRVKRLFTTYFFRKCILLISNCSSTWIVYYQNYGELRRFW